MSRKIIVLLKNLSKYWFILSFAIILCVVVLVSFLKILVLKDFKVEFPENCDADQNTCVNVDGTLTPTSFILLKESYFLKNCENKDFNECMKRCETDSACTIETKNNQSS